MIDLDDLSKLQDLDKEGMFAHVAAMPRQCREAWALAQQVEIPAHYRHASQVLIAGMGGSAISGDLAAAAIADVSPIPLLIHRDYVLPAYAGRQTLVVGSSYSGNTEETLSAWRTAHERGCSLLAVTTGGELARLATQWRVPLVSFSYRSQPRAALGYMFVSLLGILHTLGIAGNVAADLDEALALLEGEGPNLAPEAPKAQNQAKQLAIELAGRVPVIIGAGPLAPVARRWKTQFNENSKSWACFEALPEMNHNALSGIRFPAGAADSLRVVFLESRSAHSRIQLRAELTPQIMGEQGVVSHQVLVAGESPLAQILSAIQFGDYVSCYLAALYGADPTEISDIVKLKEQMSSRPPADR